MDDHAQYIAKRFIESVRSLEGDRGEALFDIATGIIALSQCDEETFRQVIDAVNNTPEAYTTWKKYARGKPKRPEAVIYCRIACAPPDAIEHQLSAQESRCLDFARENDLEVIAIFSHIGSGMDMDHPGLNNLLSFLSERKDSPPTVIVRDFSRFSRNLADSLKIHQRISDTGAGVITTDGQQLSNPTARFVAQVAIAHSEFEEQLQDQS